MQHCQIKTIAKIKRVGENRKSEVRYTVFDFITNIKSKYVRHL